MLAIGQALAARPRILGRLSFTRLQVSDDATAQTELDAVLGIGPWSAQMFLLHNLRRPDIFPAAAAHRAAGQRTAPREPLLEGLALAGRCGAHALERRAQAELAMIGVRPRRAQHAGVDSLTPSERRVAELAASGGTKREIAQALFVTEKTVETHLGRAFRKLDIASRRQLPDVLAALSS